MCRLFRAGFSQPAAPPTAARPPASALPAPSFADVLVGHTEYQGKPLDLKMNVWLPLGPKGAPTHLLAIPGGGETIKRPRPMH